MRAPFHASRHYSIIRTGPAIGDCSNKVLERKPELRSVSVSWSAIIFILCLNFIITSNANVGGSPIIDMHCHTAGIGAGGRGAASSGCYVNPSLLNSYKFKIYLKAFYVTRQELEDKGDGLVIKRISENLAKSSSVSSAIVLALDGAVDSSGSLDTARTEVYVPNDFLFKEVAKYPNLYPGASINPYRPDAVELLEEYASRGAALIKWLPSIQYIDPADTAIIPFYKKMAELGLPLLTHTGSERAFTKADNALCDPVLLKLPLELGVTVIAAHVAATGENKGQPNHERLIPMLRQYANLYADISSLTQLNKKKYLPKILAHKDIHHKLIYGTDMPLINMILVSPWYFPIKLKWKDIGRIVKLENPWDKDVELKRALGVPEGVFTNGNKLFKITDSKKD